LRKFTLLVAGVALAAGALTACVGGPPPPPPTDPHDVLVVGDSVGFSFGCVLGDPGEVGGVPQSACPQSPVYSTRNDWVGSCTVTPGTVSLYNGGQAPAPNCDTVAAGSRNQTWGEAANFFVPRVVVINTAGWEIVDRWLNFVTTPDAQWGAVGCSPTNTPSPQCDNYSRAAVQYSSKLFDAINTFRNSPNNPTVLVTNAPYTAPPQPLPSPAEVPPGFECSWWEPYPPSAPVSAGPDCTGNATAGSGGSWRPQAAGVTYRPSKTKMDQFNAIVDLVKNNYFAGDSKVQVFNFKKHFNHGPLNEYSDWVCPPPDDATVAAVDDLNWNTADPLDRAFVCDNHQGLNTAVNPWPLAINARAADNGHLSPAGQVQILKPYIDKCVLHHLGAAGGDPSACT
jgi:hypothetical protein